jgi:hypothetical protein
LIGRIVESLFPLRGKEEGGGIGLRKDLPGFRRLQEGGCEEEVEFWIRGGERYSQIERDFGD